MSVNAESLTLSGADGGLLSFSLVLGVGEEALSFAILSNEGHGISIVSWRDLIPKTKISEETMEALGPVLLGQRLFNHGQYLEAEAMYCKALENFPPKSAGRVLIRNKMGILYEKMGDPRRALDSYEKGVKEGALTPFTYQRMCCLHLEAGRLPQAMDCTQQGIKVLKKARTNLPQEIYFWLVFLRLKRKISRHMLPSR